jgi:hypothetical protein
MPRALVKEAGDRLSSRKEAGYSSCQNRSTGLDLLVETYVSHTTDRTHSGQPAPDSALD